MRAPHSSWRALGWRRRDTRVDPPCDFRAHFNEDAGQERDWRQGQDRGIKKGQPRSFLLPASRIEYFFSSLFYRRFSYWAFFFSETTRYFPCGLLAWSLGFRGIARQLLLGEVDCRNRRISGKLGPQNPGQPETAGMWRGMQHSKKNMQSHEQQGALITAVWRA